MARKDDITGRTPLNGYRSSKSNNKTKRRFHLNRKTRRFYVPEEDRWVTLKVSNKTLRTINKKGIHAVLKDARENGTLLTEVSPMAKGSRIQGISECTETPSSSTYVTTKNRRATTERIEPRKYNPVLRKHTVHREIK